MGMENILEKLYLFYEENNVPSQKLIEVTDKFQKQQRILAGQLRDEDMDEYKENTKAVFDLMSVLERENFTNGMKFGAILAIKLLSA